MNGRNFRDRRFGARRKKRRRISRPLARSLIIIGGLRGQQKIQKEMERLVAELRAFSTRRSPILVSSITRGYGTRRRRSYPGKTILTVRVRSALPFGLPFLDILSGLVAHNDENFGRLAIELDVHHATAVDQVRIPGMAIRCSRRW